MTCRLPLLIVLLWTLCVSTAAGAEPPLPTYLEIYVSPQGDRRWKSHYSYMVRTLHEAQDLWRRNIKSHRGMRDLDISVELHPGLHVLDKPLVISDDDYPGPKGQIKIAAVSASEGPRGQYVPVMISGGTRLGPWRVEDGVWKIDIPEAKGGKWKFRDLYINGQRRTRARTPNAGFFRVEQAGPDRRTSFTFKAGDLRPIAQPEQAEIVFLHDWSISRIPIKQIDEAMRTITFTHPIGNAAPHYAIDNFEPHPRYFLEGAPEFLDAPGEWHLDSERGVLSYLPLRGETPQAAVAVAPRLETLVQIKYDQPGKGQVLFSRITFAHTAWELPEGGYAGSQASFHENRSGDGQPGRLMAPAAITVQNATDVGFGDCRFEQLGGSGLLLGRGCTRSGLGFCTFRDIGANGMMIGDTAAQPPEGQVCQDNWVGSSLFEHCGQTDYGAVGIWVGIAQRTRISNNELRHLPYTGISVGWRWDTTPTACRENLVELNHIHHVLQVMSDGGGIYTLGRQPGTRLVRNRIHDIPVNLGRAESNGIFMDEGSSEMVVEENTIYHIQRSPIRFHRAEGNVLRRNALVTRPGIAPFTYNNARADSMMMEENSIIEAEQWRPPADDPTAKAGPR